MTSLFFGCFRKDFSIMNSIAKVVFQRCLTEVGLTGPMSFVCSGVNMEKFTMRVPFLSV